MPKVKKLEKAFKFFFPTSSSSHNNKMARCLWNNSAFDVPRAPACSTTMTDDPEDEKVWIGFVRAKAKSFLLVARWTLKETVRFARPPAIIPGSEYNLFFSPGWVRVEFIPCNYSGRVWGFRPGKGISSNCLVLAGVSNGSLTRFVGRCSSSGHPVATWKC